MEGNLLAKLKVWFAQVSSVLGASGATGVLAALAAHQITWNQAIPLLVGCAVSVLLPDNTAAKTDAEALATATVKLSADGVHRG